jgi:L-lactate dehydrogenase
MPVESFARLRKIDFSDAVRAEIDAKIRRAAYTIIDGKGATYYGIGAALARLTATILHDRRSVLTVCCPAAEVEGVADVTLSVPQLVGGRGVLDTFPLPLDPAETAGLRASAGVVRKALDGLTTDG